MAGPELPTPLRVEYQLSADDLTAFKVFSDREGPRLFPEVRWKLGWRRMLLVWGTLSAVLVGLIGLLEWAGLLRSRAALGALLSLPVGMAAGCAAGRLLRRTRLNRLFTAERVRADIKSGRIGPLPHVTMEITPEGVKVRHPGTEVTHYWSHIRRVVSSREAIYLYTTPLTALVVPRRVFSDQAKCRRFHEAALAYWAAGRPEAPGNTQPAVLP